MAPVTSTPSAPPPTSAKVFLCYAHEDTAFASQLVAALEARRIKVVWDHELVPGPSYKTQLGELVRSCDLLVFVLSPDSAASPEAGAELAIAAGQNKRILPVVCRDLDSVSSLPPYVRMPQWTRADGGQPLPDVAAKIETAILTDFDLLFLHTWLQGQAEYWHERGRRASDLLRGANIAAAETFVTRASADATKLPTPTQLEMEYVLCSRVRQRRSTRIAFGVGLAILAVLSALMIYATRSAHAAETAAKARDQQAELARRNAAEAEKALREQQAALLEKQKATERAEAEARARAAALERERVALEQRALAEKNRRKAEEKAAVEAARARAESERAEAQTARTKAATVVSIGERFVDTHPARAIAFGLTAAKYSPENAADLLIRRAATQLPEHQVLSIEERTSSGGPEVLPSNFYGLKDIQFAHRGGLLVVTHLDGRLSVWSVSSGRRTFVTENSSEKALDTVLLSGYPAGLAVRFSTGSVRVYRLYMDGNVSLERTVSGSFDGIAGSRNGSAAIAWSSNGTVAAIRGKITPLAAAARGDKVVACGVSDDGRLLAVLFPKRLVLFRSGAVQPQEIPLPAELKASPSTFSHRPTLVRVFTIEPYESVFLTAVGDTSSAMAVDLKSGQTIWSSLDKGGLFAVDAGGGKIALLDGGHIEQWELNRTKDALQVKPAGKWQVDPYNADAGEPQALTYGPHGEYLLTANSPILTLVGPVAATVRLWYANEIKDTRVGDVHRGKTLGPNNVAVLNVAFDADGSRIAVFSKDGNVHVSDVLPEQAVYPSQKASDFFANYLHVPPFARELLGDVRDDPQTAVRRAAWAYRVRLPDDQTAAVDRALSVASQDADSILRELAKPTPRTIALQTFGDRDERPNLLMGAFSTRPGYDVRSHSAVREISDALSHGAKIESDALGRMWLSATYADLGLIAGIRTPAFAKLLDSADPAERTDGYVLLALSGDRSYLPRVLARLQSESGSARSVAQWAVRFLDETGRDLDLNGTLATQPVWPSTRLFSLPKPFLELPEAATLTQLPWHPRAAEQLSAAAQSSIPGKNLSVFAAAVHAMRDDEYTARLNMAVLLRDSNALDAALAWSKTLAGKKNKAGRGGDGENLTGYILHLKGADAEALPWFTLASERGRKDGWPERNAGQALLSLGRKRDSAAKYGAALESRQELTRRIKGMKERLKPEEFDEVSRRADSELADFLNATAWNAVEISEPWVDYNRALALSVQSCELTGYSNWNFIDTQAHIVAHLGDYAKAVELEERAARLLQDGSEQKGKIVERIENWRKSIPRAK